MSDASRLKGLRMNDDPIEFGSFRAKQRFQAVSRRVHPLQRNLVIEETMQGEVKTVRSLFGPDIPNVGDQLDTACDVADELGDLPAHLFADWRPFHDMVGARFDMRIDEHVPSQFRLDGFL